ncbi:MAG: M20/M25/M40 family metallo-hydrolase, partial [Duodenibacillus sp.]|nr:M20/M25/M40 family metallo-hydrolase [Duodenibacillus sp.]
MANQAYDKDLERAFAAAAADARVRRAMDEVRGRIAETTEAQKELALIEAPTGHERARAERYRDMLAAAGLEDAAMDERFNVRGRIRGRGATGKCVLLEGHLDTVFRFGDVKGIRVDEAGRIHCPGICDDTRALAANLAVVRAIRAAGLAPWHDIVVAGTVREEGLGGMQGMRWLLDGLQRECEVLASILELCRKEGVRSACFSGIGGCSHAEVQNFVPEEDGFVSMRAEGCLELVSLMGNVFAGDNDELHYHAHAHFAYVEGGAHKVLSGHLKAATVRFIAEIELRTVMGGVIRAHH